MKHPKLMLVDDSPLITEIVSSALEEAGYEVSTANSATEVPAVVRHVRPDIVLVDVHMPVLSGQQLVKMLRRAPATKKSLLLLFSGDESEGLAELAKACGADGFIQKHDDVSLLAEQLAAFVPAPPARDENEES